MTLTIAAVNALEHGPEIKRLFLANERPEFPGYFERAYPSAVAAGAMSWVGRDAGGDIVMHIACLPRRFRVAGRDVVGGLTANLMVAPAQRSFFPALTLLQRLIRDCKAGGAIDFLYTDPNAESRTLLRGTRFAPIGALRRLVLPVGDRRPLLDLSLHALHGLLRAASGGRRRAAVVAHAAARLPADPFGTPDAVSPRISAYHDRALYAGRLPAYPGDRDWWFVCHPDGADRPAAGALLVRGPDATGRAVLCAVRGQAGLSLAPFMPQVAAALRRRRCTRLQVTTVAHSALERRLRRCGFVPRDDVTPVFALALTAAGAAAVRSVHDWEITDVECDR